MGNLPSHTYQRPGEIATVFDHREDNFSEQLLHLSFSHPPFPTVLTHTPSDFICFHCPPHSHPLNPPSSIKFVFIPPACLPLCASRSLRRHPKHRAPGRKPQAGLVAAVGALTGISGLCRPGGSCTRSCIAAERYDEGEQDGLNKIEKKM